MHLMRFSQPLNLDANDGLSVGFCDLNRHVFTLYFSVLTDLTMRTRVCSDSLAAVRMLRSESIVLYRY